jgi:hypothetical protein
MAPVEDDRPLLASWNDGPALASIRDFVVRVTTEGSPDLVDPAERVAVFDDPGPPAPSG